MPQMALTKYLRSSRFAKPASCETLFSRTSTSFFTPAFDNRSKNRSADVLVKPIVNSFIDPRLGPLECWASTEERAPGVPGDKQSLYPEGHKRRIQSRTSIETCRSAGSEVLRSTDRAHALDLQYVRPRGYASRSALVQSVHAQQVSCDDNPRAPFPHTSVRPCKTSHPPLRE